VFIFVEHHGVMFIVDEKAIIILRLENCISLYLLYKGIVIKY